MVERPVLSEPFKQMAFDLVGPLPKAKGGYRYVLTAVYGDKMTGGDPSQVHHSQGSGRRYVMHF